MSLRGQFFLSVVLALLVSLTALAAVALSLSSLSAFAQTPAAPAALFAEPTQAMPQPPEVAARAFILQDLSSRQTLAARHAAVLGCELA